MEGTPPGQTPPELTPDQEEMLRQMEEEMRSVRVQDLITQSVVSILNLSARRIGKEDERDLEQARIGIEAVRALVDLLEPEPAAEVRNAISQIQMMYAQAAGQAEGDEGASEVRAVPEQPGSEPGAQPSGESGRKPPPGLWVPGQ